LEAFFKPNHDLPLPYLFQFTSDSRSVIHQHPIETYLVRCDHLMTQHNQLGTVLQEMFMALQRSLASVTGWSLVYTVAVCGYTATR